MDTATSRWRVIEVGPTDSFGTVAIFGNTLTNVPYTPGRPITFLAPEPGTMIALVAGVAAMLRRKRRNS